MDRDDEISALTLDFGRFARPRGKDVHERLGGFHEFFRQRLTNEAWPYGKRLLGAAASEASVRLEDGTQRAVTNFASQDYLSLTRHPAVHHAVRDALDAYGPHSAGSAALLGNSDASEGLAHRLACHVEGRENPQGSIALFPTGWAAGFGALVGLVREDDFVVLDANAHQCLVQGATAATRNIARVPHLDTGAFADVLARIRAKSPDAAIFVVTEGLFSMDADSPDLRALRQVTEQWDAQLVVDVAHDLGALGPRGTGALGEQGCLGLPDIVIGAFSKTFASNGGFVWARSPRVAPYLRVFAGSQTFSNALSPLQIAIVSEALKIVQDSDGDDRRRSVVGAAHALRDALAAHGLVPAGRATPILPLIVGEEALARRATHRLFEAGIAVNMAEYPGVARRRARFRLQLMAEHASLDFADIARTVSRVLHDTSEELLSLGLGRAPLLETAAANPGNAHT